MIWKLLEKMLNFANNIQKKKNKSKKIFVFVL